VDIHASDDHEFDAYLRDDDGLRKPVHVVPAARCLIGRGFHPSRANPMPIDPLPLGSSFSRPRGRRWPCATSPLVAR
jgi:hypothetical protein